MRPQTSPGKALVPTLGGRALEEEQEEEEFKELAAGILGWREFYAAEIKTGTGTRELVGAHSRASL